MGNESGITGEWKQMLVALYSTQDDRQGRAKSQREDRLHVIYILLATGMFLHWTYVIVHGALKTLNSIFFIQSSA